MVAAQVDDPFEFTAHNIRLDDGTYTKFESPRSMVDYPWFQTARGILETIFPGDKNKLRLAIVADAGLATNPGTGEAV